MLIHFALLIDDGKSYTRHNPGIAIADYADLLNWDEGRHDEFWKHIYEHYHEKSQFDFLYNVEPNTSVEALSKVIAERIGFNWDLFSCFPKKICLKIDRELICVENAQIDFERIFKYYGLKDELSVYFIFSNQAGDIWVEDGLRYYMHSREFGKHNKPHVHVDYKHEMAASICIYDGEVLDGKLPSKTLKRARERILENQRYLLECWNKMTDGFKVDINYYFGTISLDENNYERKVNEQKRTGNYDN